MTRAFSQLTKLHDEYPRMLEIRLLYLRSICKHSNLVQVEGQSGCCSVKDADAWENGAGECRGPGPSPGWPLRHRLLTGGRVRVMLALPILPPGSVHQPTSTQPSLSSNNRHPGRNTQSEDDEFRGGEAPSHHAHTIHETASLARPISRAEPIAQQIPSPKPL